MREIHALLSATEHYEPHSEERKRHVIKIFKKMIEFGDTNPGEMEKYTNFFEAGLERVKTFAAIDSRFGRYVAEFNRVMTKHDDAPMVRTERELKRLQWTLLQ